MTGQIIHGDCLAVMREMPDRSVGLVVTSPPYNLRNSSGAGIKNPGQASKWSNAALALGKGYDGYEDDLPEQQYQEWLVDCFQEVMRLLKPDGAAFVVFKERVQRGLKQDRQWVWNQFPVRQTIIWRRNKGINFNAGYFVPSHEYIHLICHPAFKLAPNANGHGTVWDLLPDPDNDHPAPFPLALALRCIDSTLDNGPVLDPFLGSGTTGMAASLLGREWVGIELSAKYCRYAAQKVEGLRLVPAEGAQPDTWTEGGLDE